MSIEYGRETTRRLQSKRRYFGFTTKTRLCQKPFVKWGDVVGLHEAKQTLKEAFLLPLKFPEWFTGLRTPRNSVLLFGPPGTGKTLLAQALATEADNSTFIPFSKCHFQNERLLEDFLLNRRTRVPTIILIDEIDVLFSSESVHSLFSSANRTKEQLLRYMKEADFRKEYDGILILSTASQPWLIDEALLKRFQRKIYTPLPNMHERLQILKFCLGKIPHNLTEQKLEELAKKTEGYSGADISVLVQEALKQPIRAVRGATHYMRVSGSSCSDPNVIVDDLLIPCSPGCPEAIGISWEGIPNNIPLEPVTDMVSGPSRSDTNVIVDYWLTPCSPDCPKAIEISWEEIPKHKLLEPMIAMCDMLHSMARSKPTICEDGLRAYEQFQKFFC